jgi:FNIP Repeat
LDCLPPSLTHLTIESEFNLPLDHLPQSLTHLEVANNTFNQPLDRLPSALAHLTLGNVFNTPLNHLPTSLNYLTLERGFRLTSVGDNLPPSLIRITMKDFENTLTATPPSFTRIKKKLGLIFIQC